MNTYFFKKELYSSREITREQLKEIHANLTGMGYTKSYTDFYAELTEYCKPKLKDSTNLCIPAVKPFLTEKIIHMMEELTQKNLDSKIFALCSPNKKMNSSLRIPVIYVPKQDVIRKLITHDSSFRKYLLPLLRTPEESLIGFASPAKTLEGCRPSILCPKEEPLHELRIGYAVPKTEEEEDDPLLSKQEEEIVQIQLSIKIGKRLYQIPLYQNLQDVCIINTTCIPLSHLSVLIEQTDTFTVAEYQACCQADLSARYQRMQTMN